MTPRAAQFQRQTDEDATNLSSAIAGMSIRQRAHYQALLFDIDDAMFLRAIADVQETAIFVRALAKMAFATARAANMTRAETE